MTVGEKPETAKHLVAVFINAPTNGEVGVSNLCLIADLNLQ